MNKHLLTILFLLQCVVAVAFQDTTVSGSKTAITNLPGFNSFARTVADGSGGVFVVWSNFATDDTESTAKIYVQHINSAGQALFGNGITVTNSSRGQVIPAILADRAGGIIVAWTEFDPNEDNNLEEASMDVYAQRINSAGNLLWGNGGIVISNAAGEQFIGDIINYGANGALITWHGNGLFATRVNGDGTIAGTPLKLTGKPEAFIASSIEGSNGDVIMLFSVTRTDQTDPQIEIDDIYVQRFNSAGEPQLDTAGIKLYSFPENGPDFGPGNSGAVTDGANGVYVTLVNKSDNNKIYLQHILSNGSVAFPLPYGMVIDEQSGGNVELISDNAGGVIVSWVDSRDIPSLSVINPKGGKATTLAIQSGYYAQRYNSLGQKLWNASDIVLKPSGVVSTGSVAGTVDQNSNYIFVFPGSINQGNSLYAQKVNPSGAIQWPANGVLLDNTPGSGYKNDVIAVTSNNKLTVIWSSAVNFIPTLYLQAATPDGVTLPVELADFKGIYSGGSVRLSWKTFSETNSDYFEVLRSENGTNFSSIAKVAAKGNSSMVNNYEYKDLSIPFTATHVYYRLRQVDQNDDSVSSDIIPLRLPDLHANAFSVYPNPTLEKIFVKISSAGQSPATYTLADTNGKLIGQSNLSGGLSEISLSGLNPGVYILTVKNGINSFSKRIIKL
jgi:hypothetical protein